MLIDDEDKRDARKRLVEADGGAINGIDFVEVAPDQSALVIVFLNTTGLAALTAADFIITGGDRIRSVRVTGLGKSGRRVVATVDRPGDFSAYRVGLKPDLTVGPAAEFDPVLSSAPFSFKAACPSKFDCEADPPSAPPPAPGPAIDYLARDFKSYLKVMLDRISTLSPDWRDRPVVDEGVALTELVAYAGDYLAYKADAAATDAYLSTALRRSAARRAARLVDYFLDDGANARAFVTVRVEEDYLVKPGVGFLTAAPGEPVLLTAPEAVDGALAKGGIYYEYLPVAGPEPGPGDDTVTLTPAHNRIELHDWGVASAVLRTGAREAVLKDPGAALTLAEGDFLVLEQQLDPVTGRTGDADAAKRHVVRLTGEESLFDPVIKDADGVSPLPLKRVRWGAGDALPFDLHLGERPVSDPVDGVDPGADFAPAAVARGNVVLVDQGRWIEADIGRAPDPALDPSALDLVGLSSRFEPVLPHPEITQAAAPPDGFAQAYELIRQPPGATAPSIRLTDDSGFSWGARRDLLGSDANDRDFVAETEADGFTRLRFGDDRYGRRPNANEAFTARYRVGNGPAGNVGAEAIGRIFAQGPGPKLPADGFAAVRNPLPARGGRARESIAEARARAPFAYRRQKRAVTEQDYADAVTAREDVQRAVARMRFLGHRTVVFITVDRAGGLELDQRFRDELLVDLEAVRMAGHDVAVDAPLFVPLDVAMTVCADHRHRRADVAEALMQVFGSGYDAQGRPALFHPDRRSFGEPVYLSELYATAEATPGVDAVVITRFERQNDAGSSGLDSGVIAVGRREIAMLDLDPNFPDRGELTLKLEGGR